MQNYHKHTMWSNIYTPDSKETTVAYAKRAKELGHKVLCSLEHGWQGYYYETFEIAQEYGLKFIFGTEAYWVKDRLEKDMSNCHIVILAKNEEGRQEINDILSEASETGYYGKPRVDLELLLKLNPNNVFLTSACIAFHKYDDIEDIIKKLHNHFGKNFMLEVQCNNTDKQKEVNKKIIKYSQKYNIDIICGYDSHYIHEYDSKERDNYLESRKIKYPEEDGWFMDYPSDEEAFNRFIEQGILNEEQIKQAMNNTDLILEFDDIYFDKEIKLPILPKYIKESQEFRDRELMKLVNEKWKEVKHIINPDRIKEYIQGIKYEMNAIIDTHMADYFLIDYEIVQEGLRNGGIITKTGRGSGVSYYVNSLLGFSNIDRFISPVKLYPDRFMSKTRILETKSLPDLDLNLGTPEIFADAQVKVMGEGHAYPMVAFGTLKVPSAFKMYAKSQGLDFTISNEISKQIQQYEKDLKNADTEEDKELINVYDYVEEKYHSYLDESKKYQGIINSKSQAPCGYLIYNGDIRREIGLMRCKSESTGKEVITTVIDGMIAENYKFVKNDLLKVDIWLTIHKIFDAIGIKPYTVPEITDIVANDKMTWDIYANGYTLGVNQMESNFGRQCCKKYKPTSIQELTALVSALRPGFKSMLDNFLNRLPYTTGVKVLDDLLEDSYHYMMYQENIMTYLGWLGIEQTETYAIIKKISKKKFKKKELDELKSRLFKSWINKVGTEDGFDKTWQVIEDASRYSFNASHAYSYAYDSVYGAYLKAHYPYEFYAVMLQNLSDKGKKDKVVEYKKEMLEGFGIKEGKYKWGVDNRYFSIDKENSTINPSLISLKNVSQDFADELYEISLNNKVDNLYDLFKIIYSMKTSNKSKVQALIDVDYFCDYCNFIKANKLNKIFNDWYGKKTIKKENLSDVPFSEELIKQYSKETNKQYSKCDMDSILKEYFEEYINGEVNKEIIVIEVIQLNQNFNPRVKVVYTKNWKEYELRVNKNFYASNQLNMYDSIKLLSKETKPRSMKVDGKWVKIHDELEDWVTYQIV